MTIEQKLMRYLMRTLATTRRYPQSNNEEKGKRRGFGHILDLLSKEQGLSQQQIADALHIRPQSVSEALSILEERELITRQTSPTDKRISLIYITETGMARREEIAKEIKERTKLLFANLSDEEKAELLRLLEKINHTPEGKENV